MMIRSIAMMASLTCGMAAAEAVRSGHASAEWLAASETYQPGQPLRTALRMTVDEGWHGYWINPGEGGMKMDLSLELPEGWTAGELEYPVPIRFMTGDLPGFGYEGEVLFPLTLTPPADADGAVALTAKLFWLTCDDSACVPGDAELTLTLSPGEAAPGTAAATISAGEEKIPRPLEGAALDVAEEEGQVVLRLSLPAGHELKPAEIEAYPATFQAIDNGADLSFSEIEGVWTASAARNRFAQGELEELVLVLDGGGLPHPVELTWKAE